MKDFLSEICRVSFDEMLSRHKKTNRLKCLNTIIDLKKSIKLFLKKENPKTVQKMEKLDILDDFVCKIIKEDMKDNVENPYLPLDMRNNSKTILTILSGK